MKLMPHPYSGSVVVLLAATLFSAVTLRAESGHPTNPLRESEPAPVVRTPKANGASNAPTENAPASRTPQTAPSRQDAPTAGPAVPLVDAAARARTAANRLEQGSFPVRQAGHQEPVYGFPRPRPKSSFVPQHEKVAAAANVDRFPGDSGAELFTAEEETGTELAPGEFMGESLGEDLGGDCDGCGRSTCLQCCCPMIPWHEFQLFAGAQGFTGPVNRGQAGSFGYHQGINWGTQLPRLGGGELGLQLGARTTQTSLSGAAFTADSRYQVFLTAGVFRRVDCGLQGGLAYDYLSEDWYFEGDLSQIRGELSWMFPSEHELGFWFTSSLGADTSQSSLVSSPRRLTETWEAIDLYAFFYRHRFDCGLESRLYAGWSGTGDGLLGSDFLVPLNDNWAVQANYTYLSPEQSTFPVGAQNEAWNVGVSVVWYPGCSRARTCDYYRPLLNVADNGSFIARRR